MVADDIDQLRLVKAVEHPVEHDADHHHGEHGVKDGIDIVKYQQGRQDDQHVQDEKQPSGLQMAVFLPEEFHDDIRAARGGSGAEHKSQAGGTDRAAGKGGKDGIRGERPEAGEKVGENRTQKGSVEGGHQETQAEFPQAGGKDRDIDQKDPRAGGKAGQAVQDHGDTRHAARRQVVRIQKQADAHAVDHRSHGDEQIIQDPLSHRFFLRHRSLPLSFRFLFHPVRQKSLSFLFCAGDGLLIPAAGTTPAGLT